jgi:hypothetical protein
MNPHAPIFEAFRHSLRGHRVAGTVDYRTAPRWTRTWATSLAASPTER